ncbi:hypothetical protein AMTRI_Chr09g17180 [Amborella trichopoda]
MQLSCRNLLYPNSKATVPHQHNIHLVIAYTQTYPKRIYNIHKYIYIYIYIYI